MVIYRNKAKNTMQGTGRAGRAFKVWETLALGRSKRDVEFSCTDLGGVFEGVADGRLSVYKVTFGAEPKDDEIYVFILKNYYRLRFSSAVAIEVKEGGLNPKRVQREIKKQVQNTEIGTKL